ncbi:unnamed protein product [Brassica oleracea]
MGRAPQRWRVVAVGVVTTDRERSGWPAVEGGKQIPVIAAAAVWGRSKPPFLGFSMLVSGLIRFCFSSFFIQPLNLTELHRKSPEVVAQRNLVKIKSRSFLGTLSQKESFISTEPARNQPSYFEKLNSTIHQDYFGEPTHEAKIDNNLNSE